MLSIPAARVMDWLVLASHFDRECAAMDCDSLEYIDCSVTVAVG